MRRQNKKSVANKGQIKFRPEKGVAKAFLAAIDWFIPIPCSTSSFSFPSLFFCFSCSLSPRLGFDIHFGFISCCRKLIQQTANKWSLAMMGLQLIAERDGASKYGHGYGLHFPDTKLFRSAARQLSASGIHKDSPNERQPKDISKINRIIQI